MPDLPPQSTLPAAASAAIPHSHSAADPGATDELAHLARMSGTGSTFGQADYVALNTLAIASLLLGIASALALVISLFLFIPLAGLACALLAIRKIRRSNGTQGGMAFALCGILLSLGLGGWAGGREAVDWLHVRDETRRAADLIAAFGSDVRDGQYDQAYDHLMSGEFRDRVDRTRFTNTLHALQIEPDPQRHLFGFGHIEWMKWNGQRMLVESIGDNYTRLTAVVLIKFRRYPEASHEFFQINNRDGEWRIQNIPRLFPEKAASNNPDAKQ